MTTQFSRTSKMKLVAIKERGAVHFLIIIFRSVGKTGQYNLENKNNGKEGTNNRKIALAI